MKKSKKTAILVLATLFAVGVFSLTGCGKSEEDSEQEAVQFEISEEPYKSLEEQTDMDTAQEQYKETNNIMRAYSDKEMERMSKLQLSYLDESAFPEKHMLEVENAESVVVGTLYYIKDT